MNHLTIGRLARQAGVNIDTVRYYERAGLMPPPQRSRSGYRRYTGADVQRLRFIRRVQRLGFTLREITQLLELSLETEPICTDVASSLSAKIDEIERRIVELNALKDSLVQVLARCRADCSDRCTALLEDEPVADGTRPVISERVTAAR